MASISKGPTNRGASFREVTFNGRSFQFLVCPLCLAVGLRMITRREAGCGSQSHTECSPHLGDELGTPVRDDVSGYAVYAENLGYHELCGLSRGGKSGQSDDVGCLRKTINNGEYGGVTSGWRETGNEIKSDVGPRTTGDRQRAKQTEVCWMSCCVHRWHRRRRKTGCASPW